MWEQDPQILQSILDSLHIGVYFVDRDRKILFWNHGAETISGYLRHETIGRSCRDNILLHCTEKCCLLCGASCPLMNSFHDGKVQEAQVYIHHKEGHPIPVHVRVAPIRDGHGTIIGAAESFDEQPFLPDPDLNRSSLAAHGCLDVITGVANHGFTYSHLRENLTTFEEYGLPFGILRISVEQLERLRLTYGREASDAMLHVAAQTLKHTTGGSGFVGRWAESEFLAVLSNCSPTALADATANIRKMVECSGLHWWDDHIAMQVSVGSAMVEVRDNIDALLQRAAIETQTPREPANRSLSRAAAKGSGS